MANNAVAKIIKAEGIKKGKLFEKVNLKKGRIKKVYLQKITPSISTQMHIVSVINALSGEDGKYSITDVFLKPKRNRKKKDRGKGKKRKKKTGGGAD